MSPPLTPPTANSRAEASHGSAVTRALAIALLLFLCLSITKPFASDRSEFTFSASTSADERAAIENSLKLLNERHLDVPRDQLPIFYSFFKENGTNGIKKYLASNIQAFFSSKVRLNIKTPEAEVRALPIMTGANTNNPSLLFWLASLWNTPVYLPSEVDGIALSDPDHFKAIQIGGDFKHHFPMQGLSILVHEAKHSECPAGLTLKTVENLASKKDLSELAQALAIESCGHSHTACPKGYELAGQMNCDTDFQGPFAVQYTFNRAIARFCDDCTLPEKTYMQVMAIDAALRLPLIQADHSRLQNILDRLPNLQKSMPISTMIQEIIEPELARVDRLLIYL